MSRARFNDVESALKEYIKVYAWNFERKPVKRAEEERGDFKLSDPRSCEQTYEL